MSTLREAMKAHIASGSDLSPASVTEAVTAQIKSTADLRAALAEAAPYMARALIVETRPSTPTPAAPAGRSWKREGIREAERQRKSELDALYATGDGTYRRFGAFSHDELVALADSIQVLAEKHAAKSAHIRAVAEAVKAAGVTCADELNAAALTSLGVAA